MLEQRGECPADAGRDFHVAVGNRPVRMIPIALGHAGAGNVESVDFPDSEENRSGRIDGHNGI